MLPFLGRGLEGGRKRGKAKLPLSVRDYSCPLSARIRLTRIPLPCLSAGIQEGLYDMEVLAGYVLSRLIIRNPICKLSLKGNPEDEAKIHPV